MKILFFNFEYPPFENENGKAVYFLMQEFSKIPELEIDLISTSPDGQYNREKIGESIILHRLPIGKTENNKNIHSEIEYKAYIEAAYAFGKKLALEKKYDLMHAFETTPCGEVALKLNKEFNIPYLVSLRWTDMENRKSSFFEKLFSSKKEVTIWNRAKFIIASNEALKELATELKPSKAIDVLLEGVDTDFFIPRSEFKNPEEIHIITGSKIIPRKGIRYLVKAMKGLIENYPNLRLDIVGEGEEQQSLKDLVRGLEISEYVNFLGFVDHQRSVETYARGDIFASPTLSGDISNFMLEAMALGLPVITTDAGCAREYIRDGINGLIINKQDSMDLERKIEYLIENKELRDKMGIENRKAALNISWERVAARYILIYRETKNLNGLQE